MKPMWREVPRNDRVGQWAALYVTMNRKGYIVLSRLTYNKLGAPPAFKVLFDEVNNRIGLKATHARDGNAYLAGKHGRHGGRVIRAYRLIQEYSLAIPETLHFHDAEINDQDILVLDLRTAKVSARARRVSG